MTGARKLRGTELKRLHRMWRARVTGRLALILDDVQGPFNVGAIVRTAATYRVDHVWLAGGTPDLGSDRVGKTALGTDRFLTASRVDSALDAVAAARDAGYQLVAIELAEGATALHELTLDPDVCLVVGHEDHGVHRDVLGVVDAIAFLPQLGRVGSLNVATASALAMYEARRRSW
ncbi:MAG: TrmH family RNA methyltransferase [Acidimicrobiia bacterium]|nr:TrmH family RNA methyltransferase [Acidimicrobiia bacterium]